MKIECFKNDLLTSLNIAARAVPSKTTLPILESFLIVAEDNIKIIANDKDMGIETIINGNIIEKGKLAVDARIFGEIIRRLPESNITLNSSSSKVIIDCEDSEFCISVKNPDEFPELPLIEEKNKFEISQFTLKEMIRQTIFSIAVNDSNSIMRGELFEINDDTLKIISLDSHRISIRKEKLSDSYSPSRVIVPGKTLNEISRILSGDKDEIVEISIDDTFIKFKFDDTLLVSRLIEGEFFNVEQMISTDYESKVKVNKNEFMNIMDRAMVLSVDSEKKPVVLCVRDNEMTAEISTSLGSMNSRLEIEKNGKDVLIGFNPKFFMDVLKVIDEEEIDIFFVNSTAPCFIKNEEKEYIYIILPININR